MKANLFQITPYNLIDNNFYNFSDHQKFNAFINQIEKPIEKDVSIIKLESYNKIMYKIKFDNTKTNEEKLYCGIKYMIVDDKYWFITNFDVKKNNNQGFITYYAQLDHWASQWLTVKKYLQEQNKTKALYVERMHQTRYVNINNNLCFNFKENSPFHNEEKIQINNYYPVDTIILKSTDYLKNIKPYKNELNKVYYFLRIQLNKPYALSSSYSTSKLIDFCYNYIFIPLTNDNMDYLRKFNPKFMTVFAMLDKKDTGENWQIYDGFEKDYIEKQDFKLNKNELFMWDIDFYKCMNKTAYYLNDSIEYKNINYLKYNKKYSIKRNSEPILKCYPYSKYIYNIGNSFKEYKINDLLFNNDNNIIMIYASYINYNIYSLWVYPKCGIYKNMKNKEFLSFSLNITNNMEIPTTSNSYTTYAQSNLNSLQTNINQAEMTRKIANQEATVGLITSAVVTALGVALAPVTMGASLGLAAVGAINIGIQTNKWINTQIKNDFPVDSLNAKISDMKNTPNTISSTNSDYFWLTYFNNGDYFRKTDNEVIDDYSVSRIIINSITPNEQKILDDWYYFNGYLCNRYLNNLNFDKNRNRYIFNFYKIKNIKTLLSSCPEICNEDIEWWNNTFNQGIIVWETEDPLKLYNEIIYIGNNKYENWETELLNESTEYILKKIRKNKKEEYDARQ